MATRSIPSNTYNSPNFVISAGSVLFRQGTRHNWEICILFERNKQEYVLPKGRKDCGEPIETAAVRETFEETGYPCELFPCSMPTRAPLPNVNSIDSVAIVEGVCEPIAVTVRDMDEGRVKMIFWYITRLKAGATKVSDTQTSTEAFESEFMDAAKAIEHLTFQNDRELVATALAIINATISSHNNSGKHTEDG